MKRKRNSNNTGFKNTTDNVGFVNSYSADNFNDNYVFKSSFATNHADKISDLA